MEFFKANTKIPFMRLSKYAAVFSAVLFIASITSLCVNGLNFGLDFTGGMQIEVSYQQEANLPQIRDELTKIGYAEKEVKSFGSVHDVMITLPVKDQKQQTAVRTKVLQALPNAKLEQVSFIGPQVGKELANKGALAMIIAFLVTLIYVAMRFEYRFALSAILALIHDPILILGIFSFFHIEFDLVSLAAVLTVIGYSINDTIVVFDRVRENFRKVRRGSPKDIMDLSINQTLSRTVITSGLTLLAVIALLVYGGPSLFGFSLALFIGILIGTYSSIYVAGALAVAMGLKRADFLPKPKTELDARP
tara:strand:+ start:4546 stop:5463 length:918 start_codon:yes stop_codon:yes gene_type:complete